LHNQKGLKGQTLKHENDYQGCGNENKRLFLLMECFIATMNNQHFHPEVKINIINTLVMKIQQNLKKHTKT